MAGALTQPGTGQHQPKPPTTAHHRPLGHTEGDTTLDTAAPHPDQPTDAQIEDTASRAIAARSVADAHLTRCLDMAAQITAAGAGAPPAAVWATLATELMEDSATRLGGSDFAVSVLASALLCLVEGGDR